MAKSISTLLRAPSGPIDLSEFDPRATPGFKKGKSGANKAQAKHAERHRRGADPLAAETLVDIDPMELGLVTPG